MDRLEYIKTLSYGEFAEFLQSNFILNDFRDTFCKECRKCNGGICLSEDDDDCLMDFDIEELLLIWLVQEI